METLDHFAKSAAIIMSSEDAIISKDLNGTIVSWNPAAETMFGFTEAEAIGNNISIIIPEELVDKEKTIIARIKKGERIRHFETVRKRKNGSRFTVSISISPVKDNNDIIIGASKIARDITHQKTNEQIQARLAAIVDSSDDAIISKDLNGMITSWNIGAKKIFGYDEEEVIGKHISIIIPDWKLYEENEIISKIRRGEKVPHLDTIRITKDKREINISLTVSPVRDNNNVIIGASKIARDITEKVEMQRKLELYAKRLQEISDYKDDFMAMASHELRTPLTVIKTNLDLLKIIMEEEGDQKIKYVHKSLQQVNKFSALISDLLDVSKTQAGKLELNKTFFDLDVLIHEIIATLQPTVKAHNIYYHDKGELIIHADKERIEQVIMNLLTNAIKYSPDANEIQVRAARREEDVLISIRDFGIGIPANDIERIFTRFYRVPGITNTYSGTGIGLYISYEITKKHGGKMWVESKEHEGSVFYFTIPAQHMSQTVKS